jgi:hypothetical protein
MSTNLRNIFGTVVHDVPEGSSPVELRQFFGTLVHNIPDGTSPVELRQYFGTLVHDVPEGTSPVELRQYFGTLVHDGVQFLVPNITGGVSVSASFDATAQSLDPSVSSFQWSWQSLPGGSSLTNQSYPMPDGKANTYFNMSDNQGLWHFEGDATDASGDANDGIINGATLVGGKVGADAYSFDGVNDRIEVGSAFAYTTEDFSIAFWVQEGVTQGSYVNIFGNQSSFRGFTLENDSPGSHSYRFIAGDGGWTFGTSTALTPGVWTHLVITREGSTVKMFKDGSLIITDTTFPVSFSPATIPMWFGGNQSSSRYWQGILDEFAIWGRTLSDAEVDNLYFLQSGSVATDLVGNVGLGETFTFVPDVTGTYETNLNMIDSSALASLSGSVYAYITASAPTPPGPLPPIISGSTPTTELITANELGYSINTYNIDLLSVQRTRRVTQIPFRLGGKGIQSLRLRPNAEITGSS